MATKVEKKSESIPVDTVMKKFPGQPFVHICDFTTIEVRKNGLE